MSTLRTLVALHAHPDDEALLTGGTLARAAAQGHRVVLVVATDGEQGLAASPAQLGLRRRTELGRAAQALGVARVEFLGYADSGSDPTAREGGFATLDPVEPALRVAHLLTQERADVLTTYDAAGGYGHLDHRQVHLVGHRAARLARTPVLLEASLPRESILWAARLLRLGAALPVMPRVPDLTRAYTPRALLTHRIDVRPHLDAKVAALEAHASQSEGGARTLSLLAALPRAVRTWVLGTEWFRQPGREPNPRATDPFETLTG